LRDTSAKTKLIRRLVKTYSNEAEKHKLAVKKFQKLAPRIMQLLDSECQVIQSLAEKNPKINSNRNIVAVYSLFARDGGEAKFAGEEINDLIGAGDVPRYSDATRLIQKVYEGTKADLKKVGEYLSGKGADLADLSDATKKSFRTAPARYKELADEMGSELKMLGELPKLELEAIYDQVKPKNSKTILVEANGKAKVLAFNDVWPRSQDQMGDPRNTRYDFNGEAAVSSAILGLTAKEKSAVIFVHAGPPSPIKPGFAMMRMTSPPFGQVKDKLEETNFVVTDWDVRTRPIPPKTEDVVDQVYVIMPPAPPQRGSRMPQQHSGYEPKHVQAIKSLIDRGKRMIFLVSFTMPMGRAYPFTALLRDEFGIDVEPAKMVLHTIPVGDKKYPDPNINVTRYGDHEITQPVQSLASLFPLSVPVVLQNPLPENVKATPLVTVDQKMGDCWAESNVFMLMQRGWAEKEDADTVPPFHLAVAAENTKTKAKVIVFGSDKFPINEVAGKRRLALTAKGLVGFPMFPGNLELFANSVFWLNDNRNLIAVGPRRADVVRIANISERGMTAWKVLLWVVWPLAALCAGGVVYLVRRR